MFDFDITIERNGSNCVKWDMMKLKYGQDILPFGIADMDFEPLPALCQAIMTRCSGTFGYTFPGASYYESVIDWFSRRHRLALCKEDILNCSGVLSGVAACITAFTQIGAKVLLNTPVYHHFFTTIEGINRVVESSPLIWRDGRYCLDFQDIERRMQKGVSVYLLCSPHNPVGRVWDIDELARIAELCEKYGVLLISDEIHCDLAFPSHIHTPIFNAYPRAREFAVSVCSPSKTFNIAGLRQAMIFVKNPEFRESIEHVLDQYHNDGNVFGWLAAETVYNEGEQWLTELLTYLQGNIVFAQEFLCKKMPRVQMTPPEATYLIWLDFSDYGLSDAEIRHRVLDEARIVASHGPVYGKGGAGHVRLNIGTSRKVLEQGLLAIARAFSDIS